MKDQSSILENIIDDRYDMRPLQPAVFDILMARGWRLLGDSIIRHNYAVCRNRLCRTVPLRVNLENFSLSKSQRRLLRKSTALDIKVGPIELTPEKDAIFQRHTVRFQERQPMALTSFIGEHSGSIPVEGMELQVFVEGQLAACSYVHRGLTSLCGTYCFFDPAFGQLSLGTVTMLYELQLATSLGLRYYYHGYCYDVPSQFDYKMNFNGLEAMSWKTGNWSPIPRTPVRPWNRLVEDKDYPDYFR